MKIIYSFNKTGFEAAHWEPEIRGASTPETTFIPFNHEPYAKVGSYLESVALDQMYQRRSPGLVKMYRDLETCIRDNNADALLVTNCPPYHPEFLRKLPVYKALYTTDDPDSTYRRTIPYLHAYQHVFYVARGYSADMTLDEKLRYCGMKNVDWLPISVFDFECDPRQTPETILQHERDVDVVYLGHCFPQKMGILTKVKRALGSRVRIHGFYRLKHNLYANIVYGYRGWIRPIGYRERVQLYQRVKVGFNLHWNQYALGNQRLYQLPANGVMQLCDCPNYLGGVFEPGTEIVGFYNGDDLIDKIRYYLDHDDERRSIALAGFQRTMHEYRFGEVMRRAADRIRVGMERIGWDRRKAELSETAED